MCTTASMCCATQPGLEWERPCRTRSARSEPQAHRQSLDLRSTCARWVGSERESIIWHTIAPSHVIRHQSRASAPPPSLGSCAPAPAAGHHRAMALCRKRPSIRGHDVVGGQTMSFHHEDVLLSAGDVQTKVKLIKLVILAVQTFVPNGNGLQGGFSRSLYNFTIFSLHSLSQQLCASTRSSAHTRARTRTRPDPRHGADATAANCHCLFGLAPQDRGGQAGRRAGARRRGNVRATRPFRGRS